MAEKRAQMQSMISDWQESGKSKKQYCLENGIHQAKFYYWLSRIKEETGSSGSFIPIRQSSGKSTIEIIYPNGVRLKVEKELNLLAQLIRLY
mgnify:FL=1